VGGMSHEKEKDLFSRGNLFQEPDSTLLLSGGMGRHWPDARGIFHNDQQNLFVWLNEEDHMRIVSMQGDRKKPTPEGKNMHAVAKRFMDACNNVEKVGLNFMKHDRHGWVLTCPSNLGTGLRAGTMVDLESTFAYQGANWKKFLGSMGLQARGTGGVDTQSSKLFDISNSDRLGKSDTALINITIEGVALLTKIEHTLRNQGKRGFADKSTIDAAIAKAMTAGASPEPHKVIAEASKMLPVPGAK